MLKQKDFNKINNNLITSSNESVKKFYEEYNAYASSSLEEIKNKEPQMNPKVTAFNLIKEI